MRTKGAVWTSNLNIGENVAGAEFSATSTIFSFVGIALTTLGLV